MHKLVKELCQMNPFVLEKRRCYIQTAYGVFSEGFKHSLTRLARSKAEINGLSLSVGS